MKKLTGGFECPRKTGHIQDFLFSNLWQSSWLNLKLQVNHLLLRPIKMFCSYSCLTDPRLLAQKPTMITPLSSNLKNKLLERHIWKVKSYSCKNKLQERAVIIFFEHNSSQCRGPNGRDQARGVPTLFEHIHHKGKVQIKRVSISLKHHLIVIFPYGYC